MKDMLAFDVKGSNLGGKKITNLEYFICGYGLCPKNDRRLSGEEFIYQRKKISISQHTNFRFILKFLNFQNPSNILLGPSGLARPDGRPEQDWLFAPNQL